MLRRAGKDAPEVFTTRWAMSYLRGPMTRDQIAELMAGRTVHRLTTRRRAPRQRRRRSRRAPATPRRSADDETSVMPEVAAGVAVRWVDRGGAVDHRRRRRRPEHRCTRPPIVARVRLRFDDTKADLVHDDEYECVLTPLTDPADVARCIAVDYDDRDLLGDTARGAPYRLGDANLSASRCSRRSSATSVTTSCAACRSICRPTPTSSCTAAGETLEAFAVRCAQFADQHADAEIAKLRGKYEAKVDRLRDQIAAAEDRIDVLESTGRRQARQRAAVDRRIDPRRPARWRRRRAGCSASWVAPPAGGAAPGPPDERVEAAESKRPA